LMLGFTAEYAGRDFAYQPHQNADAHWYAPHALPLMPAKISIARMRGVRPAFVSTGTRFR
ncbi:MAG: hypothetical protein ACO37Z_10395, partial [Burkholderiaceae bacterium]